VDRNGLSPVHDDFSIDVSNQVNTLFSLGKPSTLVGAKAVVSQKNPFLS